MTIYKGLSLFACAGIAEYYLKDTDVEIVVANELLEERCNIYKHFYPTCNIIQGDVNLKIKEIIEDSIKNHVNFIIATPPCQTFSNAGKKQVDERTPLFLSVIHIIHKIRPKYILIENVPSFPNSKYKKNNEETVMEKINKELSNQYVVSSSILDTKDFNTPQSRKRSIILCSRKDVVEWTFPKCIKPIQTVRDAIGHLPSLESGESSEIHKWHRVKKLNENHILWMSYTPTGKTAFDNIKHYPKIKDKKTNQYRRIKGYKTTYKRIEWDKPAPTITMSNGCISSQNNVHPGNKIDKEQYDNARVLSIYELMLLTGLNDDWIPNTENETLIRHIIGEAVPPKLIYHLVKNLPLNGGDEKLT